MKQLTIKADTWRLYLQKQILRLLFQLKEMIKVKYKRKEQLALQPRQLKHLQHLQEKVLSRHKLALINPQTLVQALLVRAQVILAHQRPQIQAQVPLIRAQVTPVLPRRLTPAQLALIKVEMKAAQLQRKTPLLMPALELRNRQIVAQPHLLQAPAQTLVLQKILHQLQMPLDHHQNLTVLLMLLLPKLSQRHTKRTGIQT